MKHKIKIPQTETPNKVSERDLFQTPNYAVDLLIPFIPKYINYIWECAVGEWKLANRLIHWGYRVDGSDIRSTNPETIVSNFLFDWLGTHRKNTMIITNPPFSLKSKFYTRCREFDIPFALLIPADYSGWMIKALQEGAEKLIPTRRIDYITPTGLSGASSSSAFHSLWLTWGLHLGKSETFVNLSIENKKNI